MTTTEFWKRPNTNLNTLAFKKKKSSYGPKWAVQLPLLNIPHDSGGLLTGLACGREAVPETLPSSAIPLTPQHSETSLSLSSFN